MLRRYYASLDVFRDLLVNARIGVGSRVIEDWGPLFQKCQRTHNNVKITTPKITQINNSTWFPSLY